ncbi:MAG: ATP-dependent sacrificial sulfur transferase LarE [Methanobacteriaceae archaeon]|nr:ATP-dependent sacrificial sulfur transferase LarE [Methanobacteriaceae archaeon]
MKKLEEKIQNLKDILYGKKCILAFSGGSDSSLLACIIKEVADNSIAVTINNKLMPSSFIIESVKQANIIDIPHRIISNDFMKDELFIKNDCNRCYYCRSKMYDLIMELPEFKDYDYFIEGSNITDLLEDRPGINIVYEYGMLSPLIEAGFTTEDVKSALKYLNINYVKSTTCLATRIPKDTILENDKLNLINEAEVIVKDIISSDIVRIRNNKDNKLVLSTDSLINILDIDIINKINDKIKHLGFGNIIIDSKEYKKTSVNLKEINNGFLQELPYTINFNSTCKILKENKKKYVLKDNCIIINKIIIYSSSIFIKTTDYNESYNLLIENIKFIRRKLKEEII